MTPERTCAGCGRKRPQRELVRFAAREGTLVAGRTEPGRGAYTCPRLACFEWAVDRRAFNRILRRSVRIDIGALTSTLNADG
ncbi:MAG: YlxR family protein [Thermoleophilia bacterium]|nr:YlxR family protein [Thermoleophilia bacterium]